MSIEVYRCRELRAEIDKLRAELERRESSLGYLASAVGVKVGESNWAYHTRVYITKEMDRLTAENARLREQNLRYAMPSEIVKLRAERDAICKQLKWVLGELEKMAEDRATVGSLTATARWARDILAKNEAS